MVEATTPTDTISSTIMDFSSSSSSSLAVTAAAAAAATTARGSGWGGPRLDSALTQGLSSDGSSKPPSSSSSMLLPIQSTETPALASPYLDPYSVGCWYRLGDEVADGNNSNGVGIHGIVEGPHHAMEVAGQQEAGQPPVPQRDPSRLWPCQRSLHAAAVLGDAMYIFGGGWFGLVVCALCDICVLRSFSYGHINVYRLTIYKANINTCTQATTDRTA